MREGRRRRRVGVVVRRHVNRLDGRDRPALGRRDPLLQFAHVRAERRLVAHGGRNAPEQGGHLGARLRETEDVVDEQQHVLVHLVAEILRHGQRRQRHARARAGRLVHLAVDHGRLAEHAGLLHFPVQRRALARALADAGEHGIAAVLGGDVVDQLLDQHRLADAGAAEQPDLAALLVRAPAGPPP